MWFVQVAIMVIIQTILARCVAPHAKLALARALTVSLAHPPSTGTKPLAWQLVLWATMRIRIEFVSSVRARAP